MARCSWTCGSRGAGALVGAAVGGGLAVGLDVAEGEGDAVADEG
ncbi:MAG: hypothetical protein ABI888_00500 [Chloroflexota bacterium]